MALFSMSIEVPELLPVLLDRLSNAQQLQTIQDAALKAAPDLMGLLREQSQDHAGSGPFTNGWYAVPAENGAGVSVYNNAPAAKFIEFPTRPHPIVAQPGKVLSWVPGRGAFSAFNASAAKSAAGWVYFKSVKHPGTGGKFIFETVMLGDGRDIVFEALIAEANTYFQLGG